MDRGRSLKISFAEPLLLAANQSTTHRPPLRCVSLPACSPALIEPWLRLPNHVCLVTFPWNATVKFGQLHQTSVQESLVIKQP